MVIATDMDLCDSFQGQRRSKSSPYSPEVTDGDKRHATHLLFHR
jgi:hypothetical protein